MLKSHKIKTKKILQFKHHDANTLMFLCNISYNRNV